MSTTLGDLIGSDIVTRTEETFDVLVTGSGNKSSQAFTLRCESFIPRSELFRKVRESAWNKDKKCWSDEAIILPNDSPATFCDYARFVYFAQIPDAPSPLEFDYNPQRHFGRQVGLYVLAERLGDLKTANLISEEIYKYSRDLYDLPGKDVINQAYRSTKPGSFLRALMCDMMIYHGDITRLHNEHPKGYRHEFCEDLLIKLMKVKGRELNSEEMEERIAGCMYHFHDGPKCKRSNSADVDEVISDRRASFR
jgi:hypothetical protein